MRDFFTHRKRTATPLAPVASYFQAIAATADVASRLQLSRWRCFVSYKLSQLSPLSTRGANRRISIQGPWSSLPVNYHYHEAEFFRSWAIYDPQLDAPRRINRDVILGIVIALGISASFWAGVGLAIAQLWK
jgi:hypothetical protein